MTDLLLHFSRLSDVAAVVVGFVAVLFSIVAAIRSGALKSIRLGSFEIEAAAKEVAEAKEIIQKITAPDSDRVPFETEQLANYYAQVLGQSKVSFWFSLVFASIGFLIIVLAAFMHADADSGSTIARFVAGGIVDAVAALFFVQSKRAQESMAEFFDKLRRDRNHLEARKLCESLDTPEAKDALRVRLALHYAEVASADAISESIMKVCLQRGVGASSAA
jgi:predicted PurR-regulated permease PerM